jgi:hypothetical protein
MLDYVPQRFRKRSSGESDRLFYINSALLAYLWQVRVAFY